MLNANTGLIGAPVETQDGIIVTALINPAFKLNGQLQIDQAAIQRAPWSLNYDTLNDQRLLHTADGVYKIFAMETRGELRGLKAIQ